MFCPGPGTVLEAHRWPPHATDDVCRRVRLSNKGKMCHPPLRFPAPKNFLPVLCLAVAARCRQISTEQDHWTAKPERFSRLAARKPLIHRFRLHNKYSQTSKQTDRRNTFHKPDWHEHG